MGLLVGRANRQYLSMSGDEAWRFLAQQRVIYVATVTSDGKPHVTPVWFIVDNGKIYFRAQDYKVKARNIAQNSTIACASEEGDRYVSLRGVMVSGLGTIVKDERLAKKIHDQLNRKYAGMQWRPEDMPEDWVRDRRQERYAVIEVTPTKFSTWDNRKVAKNPP